MDLSQFCPSTPLTFLVATTRSIRHCTTLHIFICIYEFLLLVALLDLFVLRQLSPSQPATHLPAIFPPFPAKSFLYCKPTESRFWPHHVLRCPQIRFSACSYTRQTFRCPAMALFLPSFRLRHGLLPRRLHLRSWPDAYVDIPGDSDDTNHILRHCLCGAGAHEE